MTYIFLLSPADRTMRADISSPAHPSLPSGTANIPSSAEDVLASPPRAAGRRRKQNRPRMRHQQLTASGPATYPLVASGHVNLQSSAAPLTQEHSYAHVAVTDPQTLQEKKELLEYFQKLQVLVPSLPKTGKIPKLDIIEHVINYIKKLESDLIDHPMIQVLENNAYISGLLQSMGPEFDISHLFPNRGLPNNPSHTSPSPFDQSEYLRSANSVSPNSFPAPSPRSLRKTSKSSLRKPFGILSTANVSK